MSKTRSDLIYRALRNLGVLPQGQTPASEEYQSVSDVLDSLVVELRERDVVLISDIDVLDDKFFLPMGMILANAVKDEFGAGADQMLEAKAAQVEGKLRRLEAQSYTRKPLEVNYF